MIAIHNIPCLRHWVNIRNYPGGGIGPCCFYGGKLGRLQDYPDVMAAWNSPEAQGMRARVLEAGFICDGICAGRMNYRDPQFCRTAKAIMEEAHKLPRRGQGASLRFLLNRDELLADIAAGRLTVSAVPIYHEIVPDLTCNYACLKCYQRADRDLRSNPKGYMDWVLSHHDRIAQVVLLGGEIFASERAMKFLGDCAQREVHFAIGITTNGSLLHKQWDLLGNLNLSYIGFSIDSFEPETYERLHVGGDCRQTLDNLFEARRRIADRRMNGALSVTCVLQNGNILEASAIVMWAKALSIPLSFTAVAAPPDHPEIGLGWHVEVSLAEKLRAIDEALSIEPPPRAAARLTIIRDQLTKGVSCGDGPIL